MMVKIKTRELGIIYVNPNRIDYYYRGLDGCTYFVVNREEFSVSCSIEQFQEYLNCKM